MATQQTRRVLVVEDDDTIAQAVRQRLVAEGFEVEVAGNGDQALGSFAKTTPDIVVLDRMLPGLDGLEVCRRMQAERPVPVLMLTALGDETDLLVGLGVGADDYMAKPFSMRELVARLSALLRRVERAAELTTQQTVLRIKNVTIDIAERRVCVGDSEVPLTKTEFELLCRLADRPGQVFAREQLLDAIWGFDQPTVSRTVDSHIRSLRRKLGSDVVRTVHGVGYALVKP